MDDTIASLNAGGVRLLGQEVIHLLPTLFTTSLPFLSGTVIQFGDIMKSNVVCADIYLLLQQAVPSETQLRQAHNGTLGSTVGMCF